MPEHSDEARTHYDVLGVSRDASFEEIKTAHRRHQRTYHPDVAGPSAQDEYIAGEDAAAVLLDESARAAYDESLDNPTPVAEEADEVALDDWITESIVVDDEDADDESHDQDEPSGSNGNDDAKVTITRIGPWPLAVLATGIAIGFASLLAISSLGIMFQLATVGIATLVGLVQGYRSAIARDGSRHRSRMPTSMACGMLAVLAVVLCLAANIAFGHQPSWIVAATSSAPGAIVALTGALITGKGLWYARFDSRIFSRKDLLEHHWFGTEYGGADAAYLSQKLSEIGTPNMRIIQVKNPLVTHIVVSGSKVWLLRAVNGPSGTYRFSGDSLLVTNKMGVIKQVMAADFTGSIDSLKSSLPASIEVHLVIAVTAAHVECDEVNGLSAVALNDLASVVHSDATTINRSVAVEALSSCLTS